MKTCTFSYVYRTFSDRKLLQTLHDVFTFELAARQLRCGVRGPAMYRHVTACVVELMCLLLL